jgi:voltage-gated potassium channel
VISVLVIVSSGIGIYLIESPHEDAQITNLIDAFWWVSATVTTVGYGDIVPVTETGRLMGIALMFIGITIIGSFISARYATSRITRISTPKYIFSTFKCTMMTKASTR